MLDLTYGAKDLFAWFGMSPGDAVKRGPVAVFGPDQKISAGASGNQGNVAKFHIDNIRPGDMNYFYQPAKVEVRKLLNSMSQLFFVAGRVIAG